MQSFSGSSLSNSFKEAVGIKCKFFHQFGELSSVAAHFCFFIMTTDNIRFPATNSISYTLFFYVSAVSRRILSLG